MATEYLGKVNGIITADDLANLVGLNVGGLIHTNDITWLKFRHNGKVLLVSNKNIRNRITWEQINNVGCILGKEITIDSKKYMCRVLTGANPDLNGPGGEWDELIVAHTPNNSVSNWNTYWSICQEKNNNNKIVIRGGSSVEAYDNSVSYATWDETKTCWRPVLEVYPLCNILVSEKNLGNKSIWSNIKYTITGDNYSLIEKIDGLVFRNLTNQLIDTTQTLDISSKWDELTYGNHAIEIIATDSNGLSSTVEITFNKIKEITKPIPITSSLKEFVNHIDNVGKDVDYLRYNLKNNLIKKGVECSDTDKMSNLIDKVNDIQLKKNISLDVDISIQANGDFILNYSLDFIPSFIFCCLDSLYMATSKGTYGYESTANKIFISNIDTSKFDLNVSGTKIGAYFDIVNITNNSFTIRLSGNSSRYVTPSFVIKKIYIYE